MAERANQFQEVLALELVRRTQEAGCYLPVEFLKNTTDKIKRIQTLQPLIKQGTLQFSKRHVQLLEQARFFPKAKHDDGLDAMEMAVRMAQQPLMEQEEYVHLNLETGQLEDGLPDMPPPAEFWPDY